MGNTNSSSKKTVARSTDGAAKRVRRPSTPVASVAEVAVIDEVSDREVAALAYQYFVEGGYEHGHALEHWLRAESALRGR